MLIPIETQAKLAITKARSKMLIEEPFYGNLAMRLELVEHKNIPALMTDGKYQFYNPEWVVKQTTQVLACSLAHEIGHLVGHHHQRRHGRDKWMWNEAGDYAVNAELKQGGWDIPENWLYEAGYTGLSTEQIYVQLAKRQQQGPGQQPPQSGQGPGQQPPQSGQGQDVLPVQVGMVIEPIDEDDTSADPEVWDQAVVNAAEQAKKAGKLPAHIARKVQEVLNPTIPWREKLRQFARSLARDDVNYSRFNRRYVDMGLYLPAVYSESMDQMVIFIDTSGSIDERALSSFMLEINDMLQEVKCREVYLGCIDTAVKGEPEVSYEGQLPDIKLVGGGGTRFLPAFDWVDKAGLSPDLFIYFTDMESPDLCRLEDPGYPVLWAKRGRSRKQPPIGTVIELQE